MATFHINLGQLETFFLIFLRLAAVLMTLPVFGSRNIPIVFKAGLVFSMTVLLFPLLDGTRLAVQPGVIAFGIGVVGEILMGVMIGLSVNLLFCGVQLAGQLVGYQMGFAIANVIDPQTGEQGSILSGLYNMTAMLLFLAFNAHHWLLRSLAESFRIVPLFGFRLNGSMLEYFMKLAGNMFVISVKVAAPVMAALLVASVCLGMVARTVPRMNVFLVGMPLKIALGLMFVAFSLPYLGLFLKHLFNGLGTSILLILRNV
ncbi:MAG: hypothetical protein DRH37_01450 [Deltaproteobacteria bacterium]|nr:MAG: hypothetical protein DRH37_01450 [Deltaproteobacteria bacterium]